MFAFKYTEKLLCISIVKIKTLLGTENANDY